MPKTVAFRAAKAFRACRAKGVTRSAPLRDFFIGAHASALGVPLLTRDAGRYGACFPEVELIAPAT